MANQGGSHEQHVKAGQQGHKNQGTHQAADASHGKDTQVKGKQATGTHATGTHATGTQGGSHEQHVKAGQQSHKNSH